MTSAVLHLSVIPFIVISALVTYQTWKEEKFKKEAIQYLFVFFLFFAAYQGLLAVPMLLFPENLLAAEWGYNLAIFFFFLALVPILRLELSFYEIAPIKERIALGAVMMAGLVTLTLQILNRQSPIISDNDFVFWNANVVSAWLTALTGFVITVIWLVEIFKNWPRNLGFREKLISFLFSSGAVILGISSLIYYPAHNIPQIILAFATGYAGALLVMVALLIPHSKKPKEDVE